MEIEIEWINNEANTNKKKKTKKHEEEFPQN